MCRNSSITYIKEVCQDININSPSISRCRKVTYRIRQDISYRRYIANSVRNLYRWKKDIFPCRKMSFFLAFTYIIDALVFLLFMTKTSHCFCATIQIWNLFFSYSTAFGWTTPLFGALVNGSYPLRTKRRSFLCQITLSSRKEKPSAVITFFLEMLPRLL